MRTSIPINYLLSLNQGLKEEERLQKSLENETKSIDENLEKRYNDNLHSIAKMAIFTNCARKNNLELLVKTSPI